jgi:beta-lactam-binding protein with PASTA domain
MAREGFGVRAGWILVACVSAVVAGCAQGTEPGTVTVTSTRVLVTGGSGAGSVTATRASKVPRQWTMPNLVGSNLQQAQDQIQKVTGNPVFVTRSHDATGRKRNQVADSNWKVCTQNVPAGTAFQHDTVIDFGAVKLEESC